MIEGVEVEVEGGIGEDPPYETKAFLTLEGDFVVECEKYLNDNDLQLGLTFELPRNEAEKLHKQLTEILYDD